MGLTFGGGPLARPAGAQTNYRIDGPKHLLNFIDFPRRVRALLGGEVILDTTRGRLLHETGLLPALYVPSEDVTASLLRPSPHHTHCPFKGEAAYWNVQVGDRTVENAVWSYPEPIESATWLRGYQAFYWDAMDAWYDESEQVFGHLRDPYHRVDVRDASMRVRVTRGEEVLAESGRAKVLSETGLPNRYYLPREDVRVELRASETSAVCPYKGTSSYWSAAGLDDIAWSYEDPLAGMREITGRVCFLHDDVSVQILDDTGS